jgi:hypothetical protein
MTRYWEYGLIGIAPSIRGEFRNFQYFSLLHGGDAETNLQRIQAFATFYLE